MNMVTPIAALMCASMLCACSREKLDHAAGILNPDVAILNAQQAARRDYDKSIADYRNCLATDPPTAMVCDGQRRVMEANERVLSASMQRPSNTNVTVQGR
jgi:hypothetical protein